MQGAVYVFVQDQDTMVWSQKQKIVPVRPLENDRFGAAVAMNDDFLVIGVPNRQKSFTLTSTVRFPRPIQSIRIRAYSSTKAGP